MTPVIALVALILLAGLAKQLPPLVIVGLVAVIAASMKRNAERVAAELLNLDPPADPWAIPPANVRQLADKAQRIALERMQLRSAFPSRMPA